MRNTQSLCLVLSVVCGFYFTPILHAHAGAVGLVNVGGQILRAQPSSPDQEQGILELRPSSNSAPINPKNPSAQTYLRILLPPNGNSTPVSHDEATENAFRIAGVGMKPAATTSNTFVNTPSSIACIYELAAQPARQSAGCSPTVTTTNPSGGAGAIALVDAYDDPSAVTDLATFSQKFGLSPAKFQVIYAGGKSPYISGSRPPSGVSSGWNVEEALDIEWAHAMAPNAKIYLVEAADSSFNSLIIAMYAAEYLVSQSGGGQVSMSWGIGEVYLGSYLPLYDAYFKTSPSNVELLASSGDVGGVVTWPSVSNYVISVGGTSIVRNGSNAFTSETSWTSGGGGVSQFEPQPSFQNNKEIQTLSKTHRVVPDIALDANPSSGVAVYISGQWYIVGGTSVSSPMMAGILNVAHESGGYPSTLTELSTLYANGSKVNYFRDISSGTCGGNRTAIGFDDCTGWGSIQTYAGK